MDGNRFELRDLRNAADGNLRIISSTTDNLLGSVEAGQTEMPLDTQFMNAVRKIAAYDDREEYSDFKTRQIIRKTIVNASIRNDVIESVYLYCAEAKRLFLSNVNWNPDYNKIRIEDTPWYKSYKNNTARMPWNITKALDSDARVLSCYRIIEKYNQPLSGLLSINVTPDVILNTINNANLGQGSVCFVTDSYGNILKDQYVDENYINYIVDRIPEGRPSGTLDIDREGETVFVSHLYSSYSGLTYVVFAPLEEIESATDRLNKLTVWYVLVSILVLLLCTVLVYSFFFRPIRELAKAMKRFETGDFDVKMPAGRNDEIGLINKQFNEMTDNIDTLINDNYVNELAKRDIQLKYARNQINEHFLYNTLDSIHWLARKYSIPVISGMIKALANFYRTSLSSGRDNISVGEVSRMIGDYLYIQSIRLGDTLTYSSDFDASLSDIKVPKDIFLPLVENAIVHGVNGNETGTVTVNLTEKDGCLRFSVRDDGNGISKDRLAEVQAHLDSGSVSIEDSFALRTVNSQLELYFGNFDGIRISTEEGKGTTMWFDIPLG
jgi:two-component system sensor histidine kinase YesM